MVVQLAQQLLLPQPTVMEEVGRQLHVYIVVGLVVVIIQVSLPPSSFFLAE
jgi:hypothetical protein